MTCKPKPLLKRAVLLLVLLMACGCGSSVEQEQETDNAAVQTDVITENAERGEDRENRQLSGETTESGSDCGNQICDKNEDCSVCEKDCGPCAPQCGDGECNEMEDCNSCPEDCGTCPASPFCGDNECASDTETCESCEEDCGTCAPTCGDGTCELGEESTCPADCGEQPGCGNGICDSEEACDVCWDDCGPCNALCGDGWCGTDETCSDCPVDCGSCEEECGDGACSGTENCTTCSDDCGICGPSCGDEVCDPDESCVECPADCGECLCTDAGQDLPLPGNWLCQPSGCLGGLVTCSIRLARASEATEPASALQFKMEYDSSRLVLENFYDEVCYAEDFCMEVALSKAGAKANHTGHQFTVLPPGEVPSNPEPGTQYLWNGALNAIIANYTGPNTLLTEAYLDDSGELIGDPHIAWVKFRLVEEISADNRAWVKLPKEGPNDLLGAGASLIELPATMQDGVIIIENP